MRELDDEIMCKHVLMVVVTEEVKHIRKGITGGSLFLLPPPSVSTVNGLLQLNEDAVVGEDEKR